MTKVTLHIEGELNELARIITMLQEEAPSVAVATTTKAPPAAATSKPATATAAPEEEEEPKKRGRGRGKTRASAVTGNGAVNGAAKKAVKAAPPPEPEEEDEPEEVEEEEELEEEDVEDDETDEDEEEDNRSRGADFSVDPNHPALQNATRLREVVQFVVDQGFDGADEVITVCKEIRTEVPLLGRVHADHFEDRISKAYTIIAG